MPGWDLPTIPSGPDAPGPVSRAATLGIMAELPRSSKYRATPNAPLEDDERNRLVERLNAAYEAGEVSSDDYPRLLDDVFGATTLGEVVPVVESLPGAAGHHLGHEGSAGRTRLAEFTRTPLARLHDRRHVVGGGAVALVLLLVLVLALLL